MSDDELEEIRRRKMLEMQAEAQKKEEMERQFQAQKDAVLRKILTPEARSRLANLRMVRAEFVQNIELQLIQLAQSGQLARAGYQIPITDEALKQILQRAQKTKREPKIRHI
ncbi:MAG: DNA-binding protein [Candidatus Helarchaeota archaeon]